MGYGDRNGGGYGGGGILKRIFQRYCEILRFQK